jgi:hypothetical protein
MLEKFFSNKAHAVVNPPIPPPIIAIDGLRVVDVVEVENARAIIDLR